MEKYEALAKNIRADVLKMTNKARSSHIGSNLSIADILAVLYGGILKVKQDQPDWEGRDRFILSKGHACAAVYAALAETGFFPKDLLEGYYQSGSLLSGHISHYVPGVEASTGSLGHGLSIGCGMALAVKSKVYVLLSDGDCNEGSTWEAAMFAGHHKLHNLIVIIDHNGLQALGKTKNILTLSPLAKKWMAFGWRVSEVNGHDIHRLEYALKNIPKWAKKPNCIIAHTVKGKGVSFMENQTAWHYLYPDDDELKYGLEELEQL